MFSEAVDTPSVRDVKLSYSSPMSKTGLRLYRGRNTERERQREREGGKEGGGEREREGGRERERGREGERESRRKS